LFARLRSNTEVAFQSAMNQTSVAPTGPLQDASVGTSRRKVTSLLADGASDGSQIVRCEVIAESVHMSSYIMTTSVVAA
jgi:5-deoxy-D-glucuronate isomerase